MSVPTENQINTTVSVIVPVYAQWHYVPELLAALERQRHRADAIIIVNNEPRQAIAPITLPASGQLLHCSTPGSYAARNCGARAANTTWLAFTDADCLPEPNWLEQLLNAARQAAQPTLFAGCIRMDDRQPPRNWCEAYEQVHGIPQRHYVRRGYAATANLFVPRSLFAAVGGFDEQRFSGGDAQFCRQAVALGAPLRYLDTAAVSHRLRSSWPQLAIKTRRIKGGQLVANSHQQRLQWFLRSWLPPLHLYQRYLCSRDHPRSRRWIAVVIQTGLWLVGITEAIHVYVLRRPPERR